MSTYGKSGHQLTDATEHISVKRPLDGTLRLSAGDALVVQCLHCDVPLFVRRGALVHHNLLAALEHDNLIAIVKDESFCEEHMGESPLPPGATLLAACPHCGVPLYWSRNGDRYANRAARRSHSLIFTMLERPEFCDHPTT